MKFPVLTSPAAADPEWGEPSCRVTYQGRDGERRSPVLVCSVWLKSDGTLRAVHWGADSGADAGVVDSLPGVMALEGAKLCEALSDHFGNVAEVAYPDAYAILNQDISLKEIGQTGISPVEAADLETEDERCDPPDADGGDED